MAQTVSPKIARLIRQRAYLSGSLKDLETRVTSIQAQLDAAQAAVATTHRTLAEIDQEIRTACPGIDPEDIRSIRAWPKLGDAPFGGLIDAIVQVLRQSPQGVTTEELRDLLSDKFRLGGENAAERRRARNRVLRPLNGLKAKGLVQRFDGGTSRSGQPIARWLWLGD